MTAWSEHAIWWQLHPISFTGAEAAAPPGAPPAHRLPRLEGWLDYLVELGCNGLALGPVFASESHGYDTVDHYRIDPRLGTDADFDQLVLACDERGIRVLLDGVFNHVGRGFPAFQDVLTNGAGSRYASWFRLDFTASGPDGFRYADFEGHQSLVALNHSEPEVRDYVAGVMRHWIGRGAAGWRLDAAYAVPPEFWRDVNGRVRRDYPDALLLGEVIHGDYRAVVRDGALDTVTQYELWKAIWSSLNDRNFFELAWALDRHNGFAASFTPATFVGNHDVTRLASKLDNPGHLAHALAIFLTVAGMPFVYAGDEQAFHGVKYDGAGGDAEIRPPFPASPADLAPYGWPVYRLHQDLIGFRRRHPWLTRSSTRVLRLDNQVFGYLALDGAGRPGAAVLLNVSDDKAVFGLEDWTVTEILGSDDTAAAGYVEPHGWAILSLRP